MSGDQKSQLLEGLSKLFNQAEKAGQTVQTIAASAPMIWILAPRNSDKCPHTGLGHGKFYELFCRNPRVRQATMAANSASRGVRLFWLPDIFQEIEGRVEAEQEPS